MGDPLDRGAALRWYAGWLDAWNSHDAARLRPLVTDDFKLVTPTTVAAGQTLTTAAQGEAYMRFVVRAYPDLIWTQAGPPMFADDEPTAAIPWHGSGTFSGVMDPPGIEGTGRAFGFNGVEVFTFRGAVACGVTVYYDLQNLMRQVLPRRRDKST